MMAAGSVRGRLVQLAYLVVWSERAFVHLQAAQDCGLCLEIPPTSKLPNPPRHYVEPCLREEILNRAALSSVSRSTLAPTDLARPV